MWKLNTVGDTINHNMLHLSADIYYDAPVGTKDKLLVLMQVLQNMILE